MTFRSLLAAATLLGVVSCTQTVQSPAPQPAATPQPAPQTAAQPTVPPPPAPTPRASSGPTKVLILGDSQVSFGAGAPYSAFFANLAANCANIPPRFQTAETAAIGVRSTALHHWTSRNDRAPICDIDKRYGVNAGAYGVTSPGRTYVQIGQNPAYPFCPANRTSLEAVFDAPQHDPDLIVLSFLGNAIDRWQSPATARADWAATAAQLPDGVACIAMTTIPSYDAEINVKRAAAQTNLDRAVTAQGRCAFVPGFTPRTIATFEGNKSHFRTNAEGRVTDPGHPSEASAGRFVKLQTPALCAAVARVLN